MSDTLNKKEKKIIITLDKKEYILPSLNLNILTNIEEVLGCGLVDVPKEMAKRQATTLRKLVYTMLRNDYPDLTIEEIGRCITVDKIPEVSGAVAKILGLEG